MPKNKLALPRLMRFIAMLKENRYPNHPRLVAEMRKMDPAGTYNLNQKTVQRDVDYLRYECNAPIEYDFLRRGYYLTNPDWSYEMPLQESEMQDIMLSARLAENLLPPSVSANIRQSVDAVLATNEMQIPDEQTTLMSLVASGSKAPVNAEIFQEVFRAWRQRHVLLLTYTRAQDGMTAELLVEPHVLAFHEGCWYLKVKLLRTSKLRFEKVNSILTLAVHRISVATMMPGATFTTDPQILAKTNAGKIFDLPMVQDVTLRLKDRGRIYGPEAFPYDKKLQLKGGILSLHIPETEEYKLMNFVLTWPGEAWVVKPEWLAEKIADAAKKVLKKHAQILKK